MCIQVVKMFLLLIMIVLFTISNFHALEIDVKFIDPIDAYESTLIDNDEQTAFVTCSCQKTDTCEDENKLIISFESSVTFSTGQNISRTSTVSELHKIQCALVHKQSTIESIKYQPSYRLCRNAATSCQKSEACPTKFCMVNSSESGETSTISCQAIADDTTCKVAHISRSDNHRICTSHLSETRKLKSLTSLCAVFANNYHLGYRAYFYTNATHYCTDLDSFFMIGSEDKRIPMASYVAVKQFPFVVKFECGKDLQELTKRCYQSVVVEKSLLIVNSTSKCNASMNLHEFEDAWTAHVTRLSCTVQNPKDTVTVKTYAYFVLMDEQPEATFPDKDSCEPKEFSCDAVSQNDEFTRTTVISLGNQILNNPIAYPSAGTYVCTLYLKFRSCSPFEEFYENNTINIDVPNCDWNANAGLDLVGVMLIIAGSTVLVLIGVLVLIIVLRKKGYCKKKEADASVASDVSSRRSDRTDRSSFFVESRKKTSMQSKGGTKKTVKKIVKKK